MWIRQFILIFIGVCSGFVIAGGIYSFIAMVGVLTRLATRTKTAGKVMLYEDMVTIGAAVGNWFYFKPFPLPFGGLVLVSYGVFSGIFVGCLAIALAEVLNVIPTFVRRIHLKKGISAILVFMAIGKLIGTLFQMIFFAK